MGLSLVHHCYFIYLSLDPGALCSYHASMVSDRAQLVAESKNLRRMQSPQFSTSRVYCEMCLHVTYVEVLCLVRGPMH